MADGRVCGEVARCAWRELLAISIAFTTALTRIE